MRGFLSLIFVASLASLAVSQQTYPERHSNSSDLMTVPNKSNTPISSGYFGPLDAMGTEPIPAKAIVKHSANSSTTKIAEFDSTKIRAVQFSAVPQAENFHPSSRDAQFSAVPQTANFQHPSTPVTPGYRETPTRPVRSTSFPSGQIVDETSPIRQHAANTRKCLSRCTDEWAEFCNCKTFPGPNFLPDQIGCRNSCNLGGGSCPFRNRNLKNRSQGCRSCQALPTTEPSCDRVSAQPIPESGSYTAVEPEHSAIDLEHSVADSETIEWQSLEVERAANIPIERLPFENVK